MKILTLAQVNKLTVNQQQIYFTIQGHGLEGTWKLINKWYSHHTDGVGLKRKNQTMKDYVKVAKLVKE